MSFHYSKTTEKNVFLSFINMQLLTNGTYALLGWQVISQISELYKCCHAHFLAHLAPAFYHSNCRKASFAKIWYHSLTAYNVVFCWSCELLGASSFCGMPQLWVSLFPSKTKHTQWCSFDFPVTPECDSVHSLGTVGLSRVLGPKVKFHNP